MTTTATETWPGSALHTIGKGVYLLVVGSAVVVGLGLYLKTRGL